MLFALGFIAGLLTALVAQFGGALIIGRWMAETNDRFTMPQQPLTLDMMERAWKSINDDSGVLDAPDEQAERVKDKVAKADAEGRDIPAEELI